MRDDQLPDGADPKTLGCDGRGRAKEGTSVRSDRRIGVAAAAGGLGFAGFWIGSLLKVELVPWPVALAWHGLVILLLTVGAIGIHRSAKGSQTQTWLGWLGVALIAVGQMISLEIAMLGVLLFGATVAVAPRLSQWGGVLLGLGAVGFLVTTVINGPFWGDPNPSPSLIPGLAFGASLLLIALGPSERVIAERFPSSSSSCSRRSDRVECGRADARPTRMGRAHGRCGGATQPACRHGLASVVARVRVSGREPSRRG